MSGAGLRVVVVGATGALGTEVVSALAGSSLPISELDPIASESSIGTEIEFRGDLLYVSAEAPSLVRTDLLICCTPAAVALDLIRDALRAEVPCIDCSGVLSTSDDVPVAVAELSPLSDVLRPVVATPSGAAIGWAYVLHALAQVAGLSRVVGTVLQPASHAGLAGIDVLSSETIALLSQSEPQEPRVFAGPVAFDCLAMTGAHAEPTGGTTVFEARIRNDLSRLLGKDVQVAATGVQVPTFVGEGSALSIETEQPLSVDDALAALEKAPGIDLRETPPSTRDATGSTDALVGRVRIDPSHDRSLQLWVATDGLCLAANNVVKLAEARLRVN
jgi:aspartate-semialdehyde dehydrogenase